MTAVITAFRKHEGTAYHRDQANVLQIPSSSRIDSMFRGQQLPWKKPSYSWLHLSVSIICLSIPWTTSVIFFQSFAQTQTLLMHVKCKHIKMKCIVTNALAPNFHNKLVDDLKKEHFSLIIIDKTTDVSNKKELALVTRQYRKESRSVKCSLYDYSHRKCWGNFSSHLWSFGKRWYTINEYYWLCIWHNKCNVWPAK